jgi:hypothetical protein
VFYVHVVNNEDTHMAVPRIQRGRNTTAKQVTGRTRSLGVPSAGGRTVNTPTRPLTYEDAKRVSTSNN